MDRHPSRISSRAHPHLYEINTWVWFTELSKRTGKTVVLGDVPDSAWDELQAKGFDYIWLMGIWARSPLGRSIAREYPGLRKAYDQALPGWEPSDIVGSPYAIRAYYPDPELGSWDQLAMVLEKLHDRGMKLILDFVPNHTALDHEWVTTRPDYYIQGTKEQYVASATTYFHTASQGGSVYLAHGKDPNFSSWTDTAQLNYFNPATRSAMIRELQNISQYCDGVRCDMAMLVLNDIFAHTWKGHSGPRSEPSQEFWVEAIGTVPDFVWIAEVYWGREWELQQLGFQYTYDKRLYDRLQHASPRDVSLHLTADSSYQTKLVRFLENHDELRSATAFGNVRLTAVGTLMATLPGMRLYHHGQIEGKRIRIPVQLARASHEPTDEETSAFYHHLLRITNQDIFHAGQWQRLTMKTAGDASFENFIAYVWKLDENQRIVVVNLSAVVSRGHLHLHESMDVEVDVIPRYVFRDLLTGQEYRRSTDEVFRQGLFIHLDGFSAHLLAVSTRDA